MNMLDMHSREQTNRIHIEEMHQAAKERRKARQNRAVEGRPTRGKRRLVLVYSALMILFISFLLAFVVRL